MQIVIHAKIAQKHGTFDPLDEAVKLRANDTQASPYF